MIVVDSSAIIAILLDEDDAATYRDRLVFDGQPRVSAATVLETAIVLKHTVRRPVAEDAMDEFIASMSLIVEPFTSGDLSLAREAHTRFGKGMGHPARLNFGDCFSYALAKRLNVPLLFKGNDFSRTDIVSALAT